MGEHSDDYRDFEQAMREGDLNSDGPGCERNKFGLFHSHGTTTGRISSQESNVFERLKAKRPKKASRPTWESANGETFTPDQMDTSHLVNTIKFCARNSGEHDPYIIYGQIYRDMTAEFQRRMEQRILRASGLKYRLLLLCGVKP